MVKRLSVKLPGTPQAPAPVPAPDLAMELAERYHTLLLPRSWAERFVNLMQLQEQLQDDIHDHDLFCETFPLFIRLLIERFGETDITCLEQAQIYANSSDPAHRRLAGAWLRDHANQKPPRPY